ncbi:MAG: HlyC/CorC family transporter [Amaricoccus sp.]|nr:hemolysin family protein [Amaricoccus sp.]MBP7241071.1 HlyC/CorC family transporter [Amaricoccus sp.]
MGDHDSGAAASTAGPDEAEPDSSARPSFLARLFRREGPESQSDDGDDTERAAAHPGASEIIGNVRRIRRMRVEDVSVPRTEIIAVPDDATLRDLVATFKSSTMTRLPVYSGTLDRPKGLVHLKDLALRFGFDEGESEFDLEGLLRPLLYVPPSMPIGVLLQKMQSDRIHMALIIDEYGGVDGLVTIEDILEQIVGEIGDEHDEDEVALSTQESDGVYVAPARMELDDFAKETGVRLAAPDVAEEVDTLGGLVSRLAGRVPARGEIVVHPDGHEFEVLDADARRIKRLRLRLRRSAPGASEAAE